MAITERLLLPPDQRCADCQLYPPDLDGRCAACIRYEKRTGERRPPFYHANPVQMAMQIEPTTEYRQGGDMSDHPTKTREFIPFDLIDPNPFQPRRAYDLSGLLDLAESVYQLDVLQAPLGRRAASGRVQAAFGHRRIISCWMLHEKGLYGPGVAMDIADLTDEEMAVIALSENVARKQLTQLETVRGYRRAIDETGLTVQALADQLGMRRDVLANHLRVLNLPDFVLEHVESGALGISVAREFLVLRNDDHAHAEDMSAVVHQIVNELSHDGVQRPPNWTRVNVRRLIGNRVASNEKDWRPLGPAEGHTWAGARREPSFDAELFAQEHPNALHTVPRPSGSYGSNSSGARLWTCAVRDWSREQTRATREANQDAVSRGVSRDTESNKSASRDQQLEQALANDPVWRGIVANREKKGPNRPVTDEEKAALGSRAELRDVDPYGKAFWKLLENARSSDVHEWEDRSGGRVPPFFKLRDCRNCVSGAAYGQSRHSYAYGLDQVKMICTNKSCYQKKLAGDEASHREKVQNQLIGINRQDGKSIKTLMGRMALLSYGDLRTLASSLIAAQPELELHHAMGVPHQKWSFNSAAVKFVRGMLNHKPPRFDRYGRDNGRIALDLASLDAVPDKDLLELTASLMTYHLRQAGKLDGQDVAKEEQKELAHARA